MEDGIDFWRLDPPPGFLEQCALYYTRLEHWNRTFRVIGFRSPTDAATKLFLDSLAPAHQIPSNAVVLDIGSGAGFPGMVLKLFRPDLHVCLVDATRKKVNFLKEMRLELGLSGLEAFHLRLGADAIEPPRRGSFDVVISKAVGPVGTLMDLSRPYLRPSGFCILMRGSNVGDAINTADAALISVIPYELPQGVGSRNLLLVR